MPKCHGARVYGGFAPGKQRFKDEISAMLRRRVERLETTALSARFAIGLGVSPSRFLLAAASFALLSSLHVLVFYAAIVGKRLCQGAWRAGQPDHRDPKWAAVCHSGHCLAARAFFILLRALSYRNNKTGEYEQGWISKPGR